MITIAVLPAHLTKKEMVPGGGREEMHRLDGCQNVTAEQEPIIIKAEMDVKKPCNCF